MKKTNQTTPGQIPQKPEIKNPALKERIEILKEQNEFDKDPMKENIAQPEVPELPEDLPEIKEIKPKKKK